MNIYQKLKKSGYNTDGLASPLKNDPPYDKITPLPGVTVRARKKRSLLNRAGHTALDLAGLVPGLGEVADGANALWYLSEGDKKNAALSAAAMVPFVGWGATGAKLGSKAAKVIKNKKIINKVKKELSKDGLKANSNMVYRGVGKAGYDDALKAGVLRAKQADKIDPIMQGGFDMAKRFSNKKGTQKLYATPNLNKAKEYGGGIIAEIPKDAANFTRRYKNSDWSMRTSKQIPTKNVKFYKQNPFGNYVIIK